MSLENRIGKFKINQAVGSFAEWFDVAQVVLEQCVVVRCEKLHHPDCFEYVAISRHFEEIGDGAEIPEYSATIETDNFGHPVFKGFV